MVNFMGVQIIQNVNIKINTKIYYGGTAHNTR